MVLSRNAPLPDVWSASSQRLRASEPYRSLLRQFGEVVRLPISAAAWVMRLVAEDLGRPLLVVVPHEVDAYAWLEAARLFGPRFERDGGAPSEQVVYFPAPALSPYQEADISLLVRAEESRAVDLIARSQATTVITTPRALFRRLPAEAAFSRASVMIEPDEEIPIDVLIEHLVRWGYHQSDLVFEVGQFAVRGGVFDLFPPGQPMPVRLDLFGDTVETLRSFEPQSQRSQDSLERLEVLPLSLFPQGAEEARRVADMLADQAGPQLGPETAERITALREEGAIRRLGALAAAVGGADGLVAGAFGGTSGRHPRPAVGGQRSPASRRSLGVRFPRPGRREPASDAAGSPRASARGGQRVDRKR